MSHAIMWYRSQSKDGYWFVVPQQPTGKQANKCRTLRVVHRHLFCPHFYPRFMYQKYHLSLVCSRVLPTAVRTKMLMCKPAPQARLLQKKRKERKHPSTMLNDPPPYSTPAQHTVGRDLRRMGQQQNSRRREYRAR